VIVVSATRLPEESPSVLPAATADTTAASVVKFLDGPDSFPRARLLFHPRRRRRCRARALTTSPSAGRKRVRWSASRRGCSPVGWGVAHHLVHAGEQPLETRALSRRRQFNPRRRTGRGSAFDRAASERRPSSRNGWPSVVLRADSRPAPKSGRHRETDDFVESSRPLRLFHSAFPSRHSVLLAPARASIAATARHRGVHAQPRPRIARSDPSHRASARTSQCRSRSGSTRSPGPCCLPRWGKLALRSPASFILHWLGGRSLAFSHGT